MDPIAFQIGSRPIYWYGIFVAIGWLACLIHWNRIAVREKFKPGFGSEIGFWLMFAAIIGARTAYILANLDHFLASPLDILRIDQGGLVYYGGFIGASLATIVIAKKLKVPTRSMGDYAISAIPLGHALGRVGCFINGCCYGSPSEAPWCIPVDGLARHPTQIYEAFYNILVYLTLQFVYTRKKKDGMVFATYLIIYPVGRFLIEFVRGDERAQWLGLNVAQDLSLAFIAIGLVLMITLPKHRTHQS